MKVSNWHLTTLISLIEDLAEQCSTVASYRDVKTIISRYMHEGLSFLTITLPNFADTFFTCIEQGYVGSDQFVGWRKTGSYLPAFLQGFTKLVFDAKSGRLLDVPNIHSIQAIRQIGFLFKKVKMSCSDKKVKKAFESYIATDSELQQEVDSLDDKETFLRVADVLTQGLFHDFNTEDLVFHHGPGSTADKLKGNSKYKLSLLTFYNEWLQYFDESYFLSSEECFHRSAERPRYSSLFESCVKVIPVPKTQKKPRIIAMEPTAQQALQQSIKDYLVHKIETHFLTKGHVNFTSQHINKQLALKNSSEQKLATIDLSDASDRVPYKHVDDMFRSNSGLQDMIFLSRTPNANVAGKHIRLNKYASMGSATCFPVESLYFFIVLLSYRLTVAGLPVTLKNIYTVSRELYVYGDDILLPVNEVEGAVTYMRKFSCKVNTSKSYFRSRFRESCGMDAYDGRDITPIYVRSFPATKGDASGICSLVASANLLFKKGFVRAANSICNRVESLVGKLPTIQETCQGLGWWFDRHLNKCRFNRKLQRIEVQTLVPRVKLHLDKLGDYNILYKSLLNLHRRNRCQVRPEYIPIWEWQSIVIADQQRSPRRNVLTLKRCWVSPY